MSLLDPALDPLLPDDPALPDPVLDDPVPPVLEVPSLGLTVELFEDAEVDAETGAVGSACWLGAGVALTQVAVPVTRGTVSLLFAALRLAVESVGMAVALLVAVPVGVGVSVSVAVAVLVGVGVSVVVGVAVPLLLVPPAGLVAGVTVGVTVGVAELVDLACAEGDGEEVVGQAVTGPLA